MAISNNQAIEIKWYAGSSGAAGAIAESQDGSIIFMPSGATGGSLFVNGHQFGLDEQSIRDLAYTISNDAISVSEGNIVTLIEAIDSQLQSLSGTIASVQGQVAGISITGSDHINVTGSTSESGTLFTISTTGLATPGEVEAAVSGATNALTNEIDGVKTALTGVHDTLSGSINGVKQYATSVSGTINTVSGTVDNLSGTVDSLSGTLNSLTTTSQSTLDALHAIENELNDPNNESGKVDTFLDTVYTIANGFLTGGGATGTDPISIKQYVDSISGAVSSLSGTVNALPDTQTYLAEGDDITISGTVVAGGTGTYTISLDSGTKSTITTASTNANAALTGANTAVSALGTLTGAGQVKTYIDEAVSGANSAAANAVLKWQVIGGE